MLANPPPELWIEDGRVLWVGKHHEAIISKLLSDQSLVSFANVELVDVTLYQGLKRLWAKERVCLLHVHSIAVAGRHG